jgi:CRP/FNR family transcriptional regulator, anaerobic regulatory protein
MEGRAKAVQVAVSNGYKSGYRTENTFPLQVERLVGCYSDTLFMTNTLRQMGFSPGEADRFAAIFTTPVHVPKNGRFHSEGVVCEQLGFMTEGMLRYYYLTESGEEVTRWISMENEFVTSLSSFITQTPAQEIIQAIKPATILTATREDWLALYEQEAFVRQFWVKAIEANYVGMETRVANLISMTAQQRYEWVRQHQPRFITDVPDKYLASMIGIQPRHLSRLRGQR